MAATIMPGSWMPEGGAWRWRLKSTEGRWMPEGGAWRWLPPVVAEPLNTPPNCTLPVVADLQSSMGVGVESHIVMENIGKNIVNNIVKNIVKNIVMDTLSRTPSGDIGKNIAMETAATTGMPSVYNNMMPLPLSKPQEKVKVPMDSVESDIDLSTDCGMHSRTRTCSTLTSDTWWSVSRCDSDLRAESPVSMESDDSPVLVGSNYGVDDADVDDDQTSDMQERALLVLVGSDYGVDDADGDDSQTSDIQERGSLVLVGSDYGVDDADGDDSQTSDMQELFQDLEYDSPGMVGSEYGEAKDDPWMDDVESDDGSFQDEADGSDVQTSDVQDAPNSEDKVSENVATEEVPVLERENSWVLLDDLAGFGNVLAIPIHPRALSISSTVESEWLTDVSSVALSRTSSYQSGPAQTPKRMAKVVSWAHPCRPTGTAPGDSSAPSLPLVMSDIVPTGRALHSSVALLRALSCCEVQLIELEKQDAQGCELPLELERGAACSKLCGELVALAAEALECGFNRNVPGAMEIFEHTNAAVERVAGLLKRHCDTSTPQVAPVSTVQSRQFAEVGCGCFQWLRAYIMAWE